MLYSVPQSVLVEYGIFMNYLRYPKVTVFKLEVPSPEYIVAKEHYLHLSWSSAAMWSVVLVPAALARGARSWASTSCMTASVPPLAQYHLLVVILFIHTDIIHAITITEEIVQR